MSVLRQRGSVVTLALLFVSCASTRSEADRGSAIPVGCTPDREDARGSLSRLLASDNPEVVDWRVETGLDGANIEDAELLVDDEICKILWETSTLRPPYPGFALTFFRLGTRFIMTEYPMKSTFAGLGFTSVYDADLNPLGTMAW